MRDEGDDDGARIFTVEDSTVQRFKDVWNHLFKEGVCEEGILAIRTPLVSFPRDLGLGWFHCVTMHALILKIVYLFI